MKKCDCYHEEKKKERYNDLTRGIILAKTGKLPKEDYHEVIDARCWGTPECERCKCGGDRTKVSFGIGTFVSNDTCTDPRKASDLSAL